MLCVKRSIDIVDPARVFQALADQPYLLFLDSADKNHPDSRFSYVMCHPAEVITYQRGILSVRDRKGIYPVENANHFLFLKTYMQSFNVPSYLDDPQSLPPFRGGAAGFFGYDLGRTLEKLPASASYDPDLPDMVIGLYECVYVYDHKNGQALLIVNAEDEAQAQEKLDSFESAIRHGLKTLKNRPVPKFQPQWRENFTRPDYETILSKTIDYIHSGDIFQANITRRFDADLPGDFDTLAHYLYLRQVNPAPFSAYFSAEEEGLVLASASPERFLSVDQNGIVQTKPIKGTRPVIADNPELDRAQIDDLLGSEKDRAENTMIVDLLRNDLSKTCEADSIVVEHLCALESFASVHHLVSTVSGRLKSGQSALDALQGCFPGGSITGAPKIRAMEIIEELEPTRRGPYCGALGYIGFDGAMDVNILIRTLVYWKGSVSFQVGGGIVADSDPSAEFEETLTKAKGLLRSFKADI